MLPDERLYPHPTPRRGPVSNARKKSKVRAANLLKRLILPVVPQQISRPPALALALGFGPNLAAVGLYHLLGDEEAVASGVDVGLDGVFTMTTFRKQSGHVFRRNADTAVFDRKAYAAASTRISGLRKSRHT